MNDVGTVAWSGFDNVLAIVNVPRSLVIELPTVIVNVPAVLPAVYNPPAVIVPPVSEKFTDTLEVLPSLMRPTAENCWVALVVSDTLEGVSSMAVNVGAGAEIVTLEVSASVPPC